MYAIAENGKQNFAKAIRIVDLLSTAESTSDHSLLQIGAGEKENTLELILTKEDVILGSIVEMDSVGSMIPGQCGLINGVELRNILKKYTRKNAISINLGVNEMNMNFLMEDKETKEIVEHFEDLDVKPGVLSLPHSESIEVGSIPFSTLNSISTLFKTFGRSFNIESELLKIDFKKEKSEIWFSSTDLSNIVNIKVDAGVFIKRDYSLYIEASSLSKMNDLLKTIHPKDNTAFKIYSRKKDNFLLFKSETLWFSMKYILNKDKGFGTWTNIDYDSIFVDDSMTIDAKEMYDTLHSNKFNYLGYWIQDDESGASFKGIKDSDTKYGLKKDTQKQLIQALLNIKKGLKINISQIYDDNGMLYVGYKVEEEGITVEYLTLGIISEKYEEEE